MPSKTKTADDLYPSDHPWRSTLHPDLLRAQDALTDRRLELDAAVGARDYWMTSKTNREQAAQTSDPWTREQLLQYHPTAEEIQERLDTLEAEIVKRQQAVTAAEEDAAARADDRFDAIKAARDADARWLLKSRTLTLAGVTYYRGEALPTSAMLALPYDKMTNLVRAHLEELLR